MTHVIVHKAVRNIFLSGLRMAVGMLVTVCTSAMIARSLGPANMGVYGYAMWLVGTLGVLANIGLPAAITKYISEFVGSGNTGRAVLVGRQMLRTQLMVALGVSGLTACFALFRTPYRTVIAFAAVMLLAQALQQSLSAALAGVQRFDQMALVGVHVGLAQLASVGFAFLLHSGVTGMLWASLAGLWTGVWLSYRAVNKCLFSLPVDSSVPLAEIPHIFRRITRFSLTISYILLLDMIIWQRSEVLFLKLFSSLPQIAFYSLAYSMSSKLGDLGSALSSTLMPLYSETYGRGGLQEVRQSYVAGLKYLQILMVPVCLLAVAVTKPLVQLMFGSSYLPMALPLQILFASMALTSHGAVSSALVVGTERQSFIAKWGTLIAILNVTLDLLLIPKHGALGASIANCSAQIAGVVGGTVYTVRYSRTSFPWKATGAIYGAAAVAIGPVAYYAVRVHPHIAILSGLIVVGAMLYLAILAICGELGMRDVGVLKKAVFGDIDLMDRFKPTVPL